VISDKEIKLGRTQGLTGVYAPYRPIDIAMRAYFEKVNAEDGGVCGRKLILLTEDSENSPTIALEKVRKLIEQDRVLALVGDQGTAAITGEVEYVNDPNGDGDKGQVANFV
jgi:branched-chain amino acid transport system substrate-binding protein